MLNLRIEMSREKSETQPRKRKPPWILGGLVLLLLTLLVLLQSSNLWKTLSVKAQASNWQS